MARFIAGNSLRKWSVSSVRQFSLVLLLCFQPSKTLYSFKTIFSCRSCTLREDLVGRQCITNFRSRTAASDLKSAILFRAPTGAVTSAGKVIAILAGVAILLAGLGFLGYRTWTKRNASKYVTMEQIEENEAEREVLRQPEGDDIELAESQRT